MSGSPWRKCAETHARIFSDICKVRGWPCDKEHFQKFGRYVGLASILKDLKKESVVTHANLRDFLSDIPGIIDPDAPLDMKLNDLPCAAEQLDVFVHPVTLALIDPVSKPARPVKSLVINAMNASCLMTFVVVLCSMAISGTSLDPRVWTNSFVPGDTAASSMANGAWLASATFSAAPWIFLGLWSSLVGLLLLSRSLRKKCDQSVQFYLYPSLKPTFENDYETFFLITVLSLFALASTTAAAESGSGRVVLSVDTNETTYISAIETVITTSQLVIGTTVYQVKSGACFEERRELVGMETAGGIQVPEVNVSSEPVACPGSRR